MKCNRQNVLSFWAIFCHFTPLTTQKIKILKKKKKRKKHLEISSFFTSVPKIMIMWYTVPQIWRLTDVIVIFWFWAIFCPFTSLTAQKNQNFKKKMKKTPGDTIILQQCTVPEIWHVMNVITFHFGPFSTLLPSNTACKIKIKSKKKKKKPGVACVKIIYFHAKSEHPSALKNVSHTAKRWD